MWNSSRLVAEISDELCREHHLSVVQNPQNKTVLYEKWEGDQSKLTSRDSLRITIDTALRMQPDGFDALMQLMEEAGCWIKRGAHVSIKPPGGERYICLDSLGAEYSEAKLRQVLDGHHIHIPKIPRSEYNYSQVKRLIDVEWDDSQHLTKEYVANIHVYAFNRPNLLNDIVQVLSNTTKSLISINAHPTKDKKMANIHLSIGIKNLSDLTLIVDTIKMTPDVYSVKRTNG